MDYINSKVDIEPLPVEEQVGNPLGTHIGYSILFHTQAGLRMFQAKYHLLPGHLFEEYLRKLAEAGA